MKKPRVFIASAVESLDVADAINVNLDHETEPTVWRHGFSLSLTAIDSLVTMAESMDFAIFIFTPDDVANIRDEQKHVTRDNIVFELGLFVGTLGKDRCFIVKPRDADLHLPTDLLGLTPADYNGSRTDGNLEAAVNSPCALIKKEITKLGVLSQDLDVPKKSRRKVDYNYTLGDTEHCLLAKVLESHASTPDGVSVWNTFNSIKGINQGLLSLASVKLERLGLLDRRIAVDEHHEYYAFSITSDGIDYLLENEELLHKSSLQVRGPSYPPF